MDDFHFTLSKIHSSNFALFFHKRGKLISVLCNHRSGKRGGEGGERKGKKGEEGLYSSDIVRVM